MEDNTMLFRVLRDFTSGLLNQLLVNLAGQEGQIWLGELKKFLRKEKCWARFNLETFIGKGWWFAGVPTPAKIGNIEEMKGVVLHTSLRDRETSITGEETLRRLASEGKVALGAEDFYFLWTHQEAIPEGWKEVSIIFFDRDILLSPRGKLCTLYLYWGGERWVWDVCWLGSGRNARNPSAVLA
jgi:hypothetical protein